MQFLLFKAFYRIDDSLTEGVSGTGIGLHISRMLIHKLGGDVTVTSSEQGSEFIIHLENNKET